MKDDGRQRSPFFRSAFSLHPSSSSVFSGASSGTLRLLDQGEPADSRGNAAPPGKGLETVHPALQAALPIRERQTHGPSLPAAPPTQRRPAGADAIGPFPRRCDHSHGTARGGEAQPTAVSGVPDERTTGVEHFPGPPSRRYTTRARSGQSSAAANRARTCGRGNPLDPRASQSTGTGAPRNRPFQVASPQSGRRPAAAVQRPDDFIQQPGDGQTIRRCLHAPTKNDKTGPLRAPAAPAPTMPPRYPARPLIPLRAS